MEKLREQKMEFEGKKGTQSVEKVAKLGTFGHNPDSETYPVVGHVPSGYDPLKNSDDPDSDSKSISSFKVERSVDSRNPRMQVVVGASESTSPQLCNNALGVLNKDTGVLKKGEKRKVPLPRRGEPPLWEESKLMKMYSEAIEANASTPVERLFPPYDVEATSPDMAYPLDKIIFEGDWKYLVDIFELVEAGSVVSPDVYPTFVCNRVHKIRAIKDQEKRKRMAGILSYITHLIKYKERDSMASVSSTRRHKLPSILAQRFSSLFSEAGDKRIQYEKQKLLISYVLVLSLFADDFQSDLSDIAKDLQMSPFLLRLHYEFLGCKFSKEKVLVATLSPPLKLRAERKRRR